jgi:hypothetical protein
MSPPPNRNWCYLTLSVDHVYVLSFVLSPPAATTAKAAKDMATVARKATARLSSLI